MKLDIFIMALVLFPAFAAAKVDVTREPGKIIYDVKIDGVRFVQEQVEGKRYYRPVIDGVYGYEGQLGEPGTPIIPAIRFFADGDAPVTVVAGPESKRMLPTPLLPIEPVGEPVPRVPGARRKLIVNAGAYLDDNFVPPIAYTVTDVGIVRGVKRRIVSLYPFRYNPAHSQGIITPEFKVTIEMKPAAPVSVAEGETFAFIAADRFADSPALVRYRKLKESLGYLVPLIRVPRDAATPEAIRAKLQELYKNTAHPLAYALIFGAHPEVPAHVAAHLSAGVTDHYYRALDAIPYEDDIGAPDIGVGRVSAKTEEQLNVILDKQTRYELGEFTDEKWLKRASFIASDDPTPENWQMAEGTHNFAIDTFFSPLGFLGDFPQAGAKGGDKLYPVTYHATSADMLARFADGRSFVNYGGHGSHDGWEGLAMSKADLDRLKHPEALPFVSSQACNTADFRDGESFAEAWQRHPRGAIVFWGSSDALYWDHADDLLTRVMYESMYRDGHRVFSRFTDEAVFSYWRYYAGAHYSKYYWETYELFGDPSMRFRSGPARRAILAGPLSVPAGAPEIVYAVRDAAGKPVAGARVAALKAGSDWRRIAFTDENGSARLPLPKGLSRGDSISVSVSGDDLKLARTDVKID